MARRKSSVGLEKVHTFICYDCDHSLYGVYSHGCYTEYKGDEIADFLTDSIESARATTDIWIYNMSMISVDILYLLYKMGYADMTSAGFPIKSWKAKSFDYVIGTNNSCYRIRIKAHGERTITIYDASHLLGRSIEATVRAYGDGKTGLEGAAYAVSKAVFCLSGNTKKPAYTISMRASREWKEKQHFEHFDRGLCDMRKYDIQETKDRKRENLEHFIRASYRGGFNYLSQLGSEWTGAGIVLDINSLYPYCATHFPIPWGTPFFFDGEPPIEAKQNNTYYFIRLRCRFKLKPGRLPYIGVHDWLHHWGLPLESSDHIDHKGRSKPCTVELTLTRTDWETMQKAYEITDLEYLFGVYFRTTMFAFNHFVEHYYTEKTKARADGDYSRERSSKMILNAATGCLAKIAERDSLKIDFKEDGSLETDLFKTHSQSPSYIHMASAILSYARSYIWHFAVRYIDRFLYSDTDSLHLAGLYIPPEIPISDKIGAFKLEHQFNNSCYYKRKCYVLEQCGKYSITMAGLSKEYKDYLNDLLNNLHDGISGSGYIVDHFIHSDERRDIATPAYMRFSGDMKQYEESGFYYFERDLAAVYKNSSGDPKVILDALGNMQLPNGERYTENFETHWITKWFTIHE